MQSKTAGAAETKERWEIARGWKKRDVQDYRKRVDTTVEYSLPGLRNCVFFTHFSLQVYAERELAGLSGEKQASPVDWRKRACLKSVAMGGIYNAFCKAIKSGKEAYCFKRAGAAFVRAVCAPVPDAFLRLEFPVGFLCFLLPGDLIT